MISKSILVHDLKCGRLHLDLGLHNVGHCHESQAMLGSVVTPTILHGTKLLEEAIDCLMSCSCHCLHVLLSCVVATRSETPAMRILVATISNKQLIIHQSLIQSVSANAEIRPLASRVRTIHPYNPASLNADANLIPEASMFDFVGAPLSIEWSWLIHFEVCAIHCHQSNTTLVLHEPVLPFDLYILKERSRRKRRVDKQLRKLVRTNTTTSRVDTTKCNVPNQALQVHPVQSTPTSGRSSRQRHTEEHCHP